MACALTRQRAHALACVLESDSSKEACALLVLSLASLLEAGGKVGTGLGTLLDFACARFAIAGVVFCSGSR